MKSDWQTFQSFQQSQQVLKAINTLSIHLKLGLRAIEDNDRAQAVSQSIVVLLNFLDKLENVTVHADQSETAPVLGVDPKLQRLARSYLTARRQRRFRSRVFTNSISDIKPLLNSTDENEQQTLIRCLADLRVLIEEHLHEDADSILGAI